MNTQLTDITIVLDRSGSMQSVASDTIGGFNRFLDDQQKAKGRATLTLNQFDDVFERVIDAQDVQAAPPLNAQTFQPRGSTALLDAIGRSIDDTGKRLAAMPEPERPGKVIIVIITDGFENASRQFTTANIDQKIRDQREKYAWEFVFLGANQDAIATAASMGINAGSAMSFAANMRGTQSAFAATSYRMCELREGTAQNLEFSEEDRREQKDAGA